MGFPVPEGRPELDLEADPEAPLVVEPAGAVPVPDGPVTEPEDG